MDYLYINAIVKEVYKDLPCGCPFPAEFSKSLYSTVSGMDCISNPGVPNVLSFFTLRAKGQASTIVFSKIEKHTNSASVGRFIQSVGWAWDGDLLFRNLDRLLDVGFYSEDEINEVALKDGSFSLPKNRRSGYTEIPLEFSRRVKQAILTTVLLRWLRYEAPLRIAVPRDVDYNSYVISAMKQIYRLFPASLRAKAGFCSYLPSDKNLPETISIGFVPEEMADSRTLCLDGSSAAACAVLNCGTNSAPLDTFIEYVSSVPETDLAAFFEELYEDLEGFGSNEQMVQVIPRHYQYIGMALNLLTLEGSLSELVSQWNSKFFNNKERNKIPARWQSRIREQIRRTIDPAEFCRLAQRRLAEEGFEGLKVYQEYCDGNPELSAALWDAAVAQQIGRRKTYTEIYSYALRNRRDLDFILDDSKLDRLFQQSVEEQLQVLRVRPARDLKAVKSLTADLEKLLAYAGTRPVSGGAGQKTAIENFLAELKDQENSLVLADLAAGFRRRAEQPQQESVEKVRIQLEDMYAFRNSVAEKAAVPGVDQLLAEMDQYIAALISRENALVHAGFAQRFSEIEKKPVKTVDQIEAVIQSAKELLTEISTAAPIRENAELQNILQTFVAEKEAQINSSNVKFQEIAKILGNQTYPYFRLLEELNKADRSQLEEQHQIIIQKSLVEHCPPSLEKYEMAFDAYYGKPLILANLVKLPVYVFDKIARDICRLNKISVNCSGSSKAGETADKIVGALAVAKKLSEDATVKVSYKGDSMDSVWFLNLLRLKHTARTAGDTGRLEDVFYALVEEGTFSGNELVPAVDMMSRCELKLMKLFKEILRGEFCDATEQQYRMAFERILENSDKNPKEVLEHMARAERTVHGEVDKAASQAFQRFYRDHTSKKGPGKCNKLMIPIICGLAAVILALIVAVVVLVIKGKEPPAPPAVPTTVATLPVETEPPVVYPEEFEFYARDAEGIALLYGSDAATDFASRSQKVSELLDAVDEETASMILDYFSKLQGTVVTIDDKGTTVSWEESFFWTCWYFADQEIESFRTAVAQIEPAEQVRSVLRVIHHDLPELEQAVPEETTPVETVAETVAETTPAETAPAETAVQTEPTEATVETVPEETQPPITIGDVKDRIVTAAEATYAASQTYATRLQLVLKLFGGDFQKRFDAHAEEAAIMDLMANPHFLKHYQMLPGDTMIAVGDSAVEVKWNTYVFWECWLLAQRGTTAVDGNTFNGDLHEEVTQILTAVHQLVSEEEYPVNLEVQTGEAAEPAAESAEVPEHSILSDTRIAFEEARLTYQAILEGVKAQ